MLSFVCQWDSYEEQCFMQRIALSIQLALPVCVRLDDYFPDCGLGVEDHQKGLHVISFCGVGQRGRLRLETKDTC